LIFGHFLRNAGLWLEINKLSRVRPMSESLDEAGFRYYYTKLVTPCDWLDFFGGEAAAKAARLMSRNLFWPSLSRICEWF
jgi:hypothetical protein